MHRRALQRDLMHERPLRHRHRRWTLPTNTILVDPCGQEVGERHAPRLAGSRVTAGKRHVRQVTCANETGTGHHKKFTAPRCAV